MYPRLVIDLNKFEHNLKTIKRKLERSNISLMFVTKSFCAMPRITEIADKYVDFFGDARIENIEKMSRLTKPKALIRLPMISKARQVVKTAEISMNSELEVIKALDYEAGESGVVHKVVLMADLGDLREGYLNLNELLRDAKEISKLKNVEIYGLGVNLTCFGGLIPTKEHMEKLLEWAYAIEKQNGIKLAMISGGSSSSLPLVDNKTMPAGINNLRLGESIICGRETAYGSIYDDLFQDVFTLEGEIVELKKKPSVPYGETGLNALGKEPAYIDRGVRSRAIIAVGEQDICADGLFPREGKIVLGASSDHLILDVDESAYRLKTGDIIMFNLSYATILQACTSPYVTKSFLN